MRRRKRVTRAEAAGIGPDVLAYFRTGERTGWLPHETKLRELWRSHRDTLLSQWIAEHPGTRPAMWWLYDAPEPERRQLGGLGVRVDGKFRNLRVEPECGSPAFDSINASCPPKFESQAAYLDRHGLLTDGERALLPPDAFAPETVLLDE